MARRVKIGSDTTEARDTSPDQTKAISNAKVDGGSSSDGGGFLLDLFSTDTERELSQEEVLRAYHESPPLHMAVSAIARAVGEVDYQWTDGEPDDFSLGRPNRWHQSSEFFGVLAAYVMLTGETVAPKIEAAGGVELIPFPAHLIDEPESFGQQWSLENAGVSLTETEFDRDELVVLQEPSLLDPYMEGRGAGQVLGSDIDIDTAGADHTAAYLENHARPDMLVSLPDVTKSDLKRFRESMRQRHGGPRNSGQLEAFESDIDVETLMSPFDDLGMVHLRKYSAKVAREIFGIPPSIIGDVSDTNRATAETEEFLFKKNVIKPLVSKIVEALNEQFVKVDLDTDSRITTGKIVPEDKPHRRELMIRLPQAFLVDDARQLAGLEPFGDARGEQTLAEAMPAEAQTRGTEPAQKKRRRTPRPVHGSRPTTSASSDSSTRSASTTSRS